MNEYAEMVEFPNRPGVRVRRLSVGGSMKHPSNWTGKFVAAVEDDDCVVGIVVKVWLRRRQYWDYRLIDSWSWKWWCDKGVITW